MKHKVNIGLSSMDIERLATVRGILQARRPRAAVTDGDVLRAALFYVFNHRSDFGAWFLMITNAAVLGHADTPGTADLDATKSRPTRRETRRSPRPLSRPKRP